MLKYFFILISLILLNTYITKSQDYSGLKDIPLQDPADFPKAELKVLECANFLLSSPMNNKDINRLLAAQFIIRWMSGTPEYMFTLDKNIATAVKSDVDLMSVAMACMAKYALENKNNASDSKNVTYNSLILLLNYCEVPSNNVKIHKDLKKMIAAKNEGKLKEYLKI